MKLDRILLSIGIPPIDLSISPVGPLKIVCFPTHRKRNPIANIPRMPRGKSQLLVCGAPTSTYFSLRGRSFSTVQPNIRKTNFESTLSICCFLLSKTNEKLTRSPQYGRSGAALGYAGFDAAMHLVSPSSVTVQKDFTDLANCCW